MNEKVKAGLTAGALIALVTFFQTIFDNRYVLKAEYNEVKTAIEIIKEKMVTISADITDIKLLLKEAKK